MLICKIFYENLYIKSQVLYPLIAIVIIQILSNTPRANWEMLKNENCTCSSKEYTYRISYHTIHLLNVLLKSKTENISIIITITIREPVLVKTFDFSMAI